MFVDDDCRAEDIRSHIVTQVSLVAEIKRTGGQPHIRLFETSPPVP